MFKYFVRLPRRVHQVQSYISTVEKYSKHKLINNNATPHWLCEYVPLKSFVMKYSNTNSKICWKCKSLSQGKVFCPNCNILQPLDTSLNYFEILGIEKSFQLNKSQLIKIYRNLQTIFHPDKFSIKSEEEQAIALEHSSAVNKAYNTLSNPVTRAEYMLVEAGEPISEGEISLEHEFLMDIMEINEKLADADDKEVVKEISDKNNAIMEDLIRKAEKYFADEDIKEAKKIVAKLKYYNNIYEKVKEYETKHGIYD
ncbi:UNVERIFIED_CONTAM: hypothetical protein RMT77_008618 [Armadillidium vulgare]